MGLTDRMRAAVFARDKAICSFSGQSVWALDYGTAPFWQMDWPDHVRPVSRGGGNTIENLVCASAFNNYKRRNNTADRSYLFKDGRPTSAFFWSQGELSPDQARVLADHAPLTDSDWYFNRGVSNVLIALDVDWEGAKVVRGPSYWLKAACKHFATWRRLSGEEDATSFLRRGLVRYPDAPDVRLMMTLAAKDEHTICRVFRRLRKHHKANADAMNAFIGAGTQAKRSAVLRRALKQGKATEPLLAVLRHNLAVLGTIRESTPLLSP